MKTLIDDAVVETQLNGKYFEIRISHILDSEDGGRTFEEIRCGVYMDTSQALALALDILKFVDERMKAERE